MSNHANADSSMLNEQLIRERERAEDLLNRVTKLNKEIAEANQRETDVRLIKNCLSFDFQSSQVTFQDGV